MIDLGIVITGSIGLLSTVVSGWASWFFARKKYNAEVDNTLIQGMQESLEFYQKLSDDNRDRLEDVQKRNKELEEEVRELKRQMFDLVNNICLNLTCTSRIREKQIKVNENSSKENI